VVRYLVIGKSSSKYHSPQHMNTRQINYIDPNENLLEIEAEQALLRGVERNFRVYCDLIVANYAIAGIDVLNYPAKREIYYIEDES